MNNIGESIVENGDLVDFGAYGKLYVSDAYYRGDFYWVTNNEADRFDTDCPGRTIQKDLAVEMVEKWDW